MATTKEIDEPKRTDERDKEIIKLMKILDIIVGKLGDAETIKLGAEIDNKIIDIDTSDELAGVLMTVFTCLQKEQNDPTGHQRFKEYVVKVNGINVAIQAVVEEVKANKIELDFIVATPIVELMTLFRSFFHEVRTGVTRFRDRSSVAKKNFKRDATGKTKGSNEKEKDATQTIIQYGLGYRHIRLLQGITLAPGRRSEVVTSLGPLTQAILLVMEDKFHTKLANALTNSLQMLPMCNEIVNCLKEARTPGQVQGILRELGDILLMTTARSTQKIYFPVLLISYMWKHKPTSLNWSFSGAPMMKYYNLVVDAGVKFRIRTGADIIKTSEVLFHSIFGTYLEDLSLLAQITTNVKWHQRKDLNSVFYKRASQSKADVVPIKFKYVWKMSQSLLTNNLGNVNSMAIGRPSFSGFRKRTFTQEFLTYLQKGKVSHSFSSDPQHLLSALRKTKDSLVEKKDSLKILVAATKEWEEEIEEGWIASNVVPVEGGLEFYSTNN